MARISAEEIERLKGSVSLERLIESSGVVLAKRGNDLVGLCPFHEEDTPSFVVSPEKNLYHCFGCNVGGGVIDWVMARQKVSFRHAVELLRDGASHESSSPLATSSLLKSSPTRRLPPPVRLDVDDQALLQQVVDYYHETLKQSPEALAYLQSRGLDGSLIERFKLGYANRTLGLRLPEKTRKAGAQIRARLEAIGIYRASGHEHFNGSLVVPVIDEAGKVHEVYGRKIINNLRAGTPLHLYLSGPHKGVWNIEGVAGSKGEVILTEALIDAMTFWCAGYRNVTASYGANGFTDDHLAAFKRYGVERVLIAYDRDEAGELGATAVAKTLMAAGIACYRIVFPKGLDANAYALKVTPATKSLGLLIRKAQWLGGGSAAHPGDGREPSGTAPAITSAPDAMAVVFGVNNMPEHEDAAAAESPSFLAASEATQPCRGHGENRTDVPSSAALLSLGAFPRTPAPAPPPLPEPLIASPLPAAPAEDAVLAQTEQELTLQLGDRRYRIRGWKKPLTPESLKINLLVHRGVDGADGDDQGAAYQAQGRFHVDTIDLYSAKARAGFIKQAGIELGESEEVLKHDLGRVLLKLEALQDKELTSALVKDTRPLLSEDERDAALDLLKAPDLIDRILADFAACGVVGEATNTLTGYLACVSRLLDRPLAVIIQSSSAAGKSSLMDAVLALMPAQAQVRYSAMTGQSLFYMGETNLKHRILAIAEEEGASTASYALKLLQSDGEVTIASTGKDATTGLLTTHEYRVEGPVMLFLTTTAIDIDEELLNRCMVLSVNESREQTRAIHVLQRRRQTLEGLLANEDRHAILALHRNAQGLLEAVKVVNPFADELTFIDDKTRTRRDHMKYLTLIQSIALLHQRQRPIRTIEHRGQHVRYIEVEASDITLANRLANEVLGRTLDELPPQTRALLGTLHTWAVDQCAVQAIRRADFRFSRREVRALTGWGDTQLKLHLSRLAELEYLIIHRGTSGPAGGVAGFVYELLYDGEGANDAPFVMGLSAVTTTAQAVTMSKTPSYDAVRSGVNEVRSDKVAVQSPLGRALVGPRSGGGRSAKKSAIPQPEPLCADEAENVPEMHYTGLKNSVLSVVEGGGGSYPHPVIHPPLAASA